MAYRAIIPAVLAFGVLVAAAPQDKPTSVKDVMNGVHKGGKDSLITKILDGKGTDDDIKKLVMMYEFLATQKAPMGDEKSWKDKTTALVAAAKEVSEKKPVDNLKKASNCKACHDIHRPKK